MSETPAKYQSIKLDSSYIINGGYALIHNSNWMGIDYKDHVSRIVAFNTHAGKESTKRELVDPIVHGAMDLVDEEYKETMTAFVSDNKEEVVDGLCDLVVVCVGALFDMGVNPQEAMNRICSSNESKFCLTLDDAEKSVDKYQTDERYSDVCWHEQKSPSNPDKLYYVIKGKTSNGKWKILKPHNWSAPKLSDIL